MVKFKISFMWFISDFKHAMNIIITSENPKTKSFNLNKFSISLFTISFLIILLISLIISYAFLKYSVSNQTLFSRNL